MGLEELEKAVMQKSAAEEESILAAAREEAKRVLEEARSQGKQLAEKTVAEAHALSAEEFRKVSSAKLRAKKIVAEGREEAVVACLKELRANLKELAAAKNGEKRKLYESLLLLLAKKAAAEIGDGVVIHCRPVDENVARRAGPTRPSLSVPGVIAFSKDALVKSDNTFDALLEEKQDALKQKAYALLFAKHPREEKKRVHEQKQPAKKEIAKKEARKKKEEKKTKPGKR